MSGVMPLPWIERPFGVKYFAVVSRSPEPSESGMIVWTEPLPKVCVPRTIARFQSWSAPAEVRGAHRLHPDLLARDVEVLGLGPALTDHGDRHLGTGLAAHPLDGVRELHVLGREAVDLDDPVARLEPRAVRGRPLDRRDDRQDVVLQRDLDAEAAEAPRRFHLHLAVALGVEEGAVRVEAAQRALDRAVDEVLQRGLVDVLGLDDREHLREQPELLVGRAGVRALAGHGPAERQGEHDEERTNHKCLLHGFPLKSLASPAAGATPPGPAAFPDSAPRSIAEAPPRRPCPPPYQSAAPAARPRPPSPRSRRCGRRACRDRK